MRKRKIAAYAATSLGTLILSYSLATGNRQLVENFYPWVNTVYWIFQNAASETGQRDMSILEQLRSTISSFFPNVSEHIGELVLGDSILSVGVYFSLRQK